MRTWIVVAASLALGISALPVCAAAHGSDEPNQQSIDALEARANLAQPREQCFLYAQLVQQMTELSIRQYADGDFVKANLLLRHIQQITQKIHLSLANNDKRLKNAEILLNHTAFRLNEMLHASSLEDRSLVEETLARVNQAQNATMLQVFRK
jgi:hypothetical protein